MENWDSIMLVRQQEKWFVLPTAIHVAVSVTFKPIGLFVLMVATLDHCVTINTTLSVSNMSASINWSNINYACTKLHTFMAKSLLISFEFDGSNNKWILSSIWSEIDIYNAIE